MSHPPLLETLQQIEIFRGLKPFLLRHLCDNAEHLFAPKGTYIIHKGDAGQSMYILLTGQVHIPVHNRQGQHIYTSELGIGQIFGEMALLTGQPRRNDVIAATDCQCLCLSKDTVEELMRGYPNIAQMLTAILIERMNRTGTPHTVGKYALLKELARGSMAIVYDGFHPVLERPLAIKMLHHELVYQPQFAARFRNEARIIAHLRHPHIVEVFDLEEAYATFFIVMEKIKGIELQQAIQTRGRIPYPDARRILEQLLGALSFAHQQGVIHRDIKPSNVMLDHDGNVKLMDFGIALLPHHQDAPDESQMLLGTPHYMAPEQHRCAEIDPRTDIYALGILAYHMLAGRLPFQGNITEIAAQQQARGALQPAKECPGIPEDLEQFIITATALDPDQRPASCDAILQRLDLTPTAGYPLSQLNAQTLTFAYPSHQQPVVRALLEKYQERTQSLPHVATHIK